MPIHDDAGAVIGAIGFALFDELRSLSPMLKRYQSMQLNMRPRKRFDFKCPIEVMGEVMQKAMAK